MDYKKYYKSDCDGTYTLHFLNTNKFSPDEIKEIFSKFGEVLAVNVTSTETGFRFVKYKTLDAAKNCLDGLKDNNEITILPEKKDQYKRMDKNSSQKQTGNTDKQSNGNFMYNKKFSETKFQKERLTYNTRTSNYGNKTDDADSFLNTTFSNIGFLNTGSEATSHGYKSNTYEIKASDKQDVFKEKHSLPQKRSFNSNSSSNGINYERYYKLLKDGTYMMHFVNKKNFSVDKMRNIFSEYGPVLSVSPGGDNNRLVFVRYRSTDHIISCLNGLQNNNLINILPHKDKIIQADQKDLNQRQMTVEDSHQKILDGKQVNSTFTSETGAIRKQAHIINNIKTSDWDNRSNNSADIDSQSSRHNHKSNTTKCEKPSSQIVKTKLHSSTKIEGNTHINKNMCDNKTSMLNYDTEIMQKEFVCPLQSKDASSKIRIIPLQEIIVANIPGDYDVHYILHLFRKYDPISATFINVTFETNIRYCRVYFKTIQDAVAVEKEFDNYVLSGKNLIVLRESKLTEES
ncbi:uncharacterized protein [Linepithema humile]|uniref:uncharacterized protein n=1 Tax=Linepithema humile TaxID=83485 RepID=UPI0006236189|nr:PREDICTED: uncharacterized protein LOC105670197 [Linepithema humile]